MNEMLSSTSHEFVDHNGTREIPDEVADRIWQRILTSDFDERNFVFGEEDANLLRDFASTEFRSGIRRCLPALTGWQLHLFLIIQTNEPCDTELFDLLNRSAQSSEPIISSFARSELSRRRSVEQPLLTNYVMLASQSAATEPLWIAGK
jgi:hypothetical protein